MSWNYVGVLNLTGDVNIMLGDGTVVQATSGMHIPIGSSVQLSPGKGLKVEVGPDNNDVGFSGTIIDVEELSHNPRVLRNCQKLGDLSIPHNYEMHTVTGIRG
jgi:hypothetical protein